MSEALARRHTVAAPPHIGTSAEMRDAAIGLALRINVGEFGALDVAARCDLRALTLTMLRWADEIEGAACDG